MVAAEQLLTDWMPEACILRISLPMGVSFNGHAGAIDWIQSRFKKGRPATLYFDEIRTPAYTDCLNRLYERVLSGDLCGLYHAGGPRAYRCTRSLKSSTASAATTRICLWDARANTRGRFRPVPAMSP